MRTQAQPVWLRDAQGLLYRTVPLRWRWDRLLLARVWLSNGFYCGDFFLRLDYLTAPREWRVEQREARRESSGDRELRVLSREASIASRVERVE